MWQIYRIILVHSCALHSFHTPHPVIIITLLMMAATVKYNSLFLWKKEYGVIQMSLPFTEVSQK